MKLGIRLLDNQSALNSLIYRNNIKITSGENAEVLLQLVDLDTASNANQVGNRYMPSNAATLDVIIKSVNNANILSKSASMKFPSDDRSIWSVMLTAADTAKIGSVDIIATLTDGASVKKALGSQLIIPDSGNPYQC